MRALVDRSWFQDAEEGVSTQVRTERALERITDERAREARARIAEEKRKEKERSKRPVLLKKMHPVSYWSDILGIRAQTISQWCKHEELQAQWLRNEWRITEEAMMDFLERENRKRGR